MSKGKEIIVLSDSSEAISDNQSDYNELPKDDGNQGSSKKKLPPLGSKERPRPEVTPAVAKVFRNGSDQLTPELLSWYGYADLHEYLDDTHWGDPDETENDNYDEFPAETDDESDEPKINETKCKSTGASTGRGTIGPEKYVPVGKATGKWSYPKSPVPITGVVLGLGSICTWDGILEKMGKRPAGNT